MTLYDALHISPDATPDQIKAAHRKAAKRTHPDAGGEREAFDRVQRAWLVLSDPDKRAKYDRTGVEDDTPGNTEDQAVISLVGQAVLSVVMSGEDLSRLDVIAQARRAIMGTKSELGRQKVAHEAAAKRLQDARARLSRKPDAAGADMLALMIEGQERAIAGALEQNAAESRRVARALEMLDAYSYRVDPMQPPPAGMFGSNTATNSPHGRVRRLDEPAELHGSGC